MEPTLIELIAEGEHVRQDFKFKIDELRKIGRTLCAFANTEGGRLLIGINDKRKIVGCNPTEQLQLIENASRMFCQPEVKYTSKIWQEDYRLVLEILVAESNEKPHKAKDDDGKWHSYIRIFDQTTVVNKIVERVWTEKKNPTPLPVKLNEEELILLNIIRNEQPISLSKIYRKANLQLRLVDKMLVFLICRDFVEMLFEKEGILYRIKDSAGFNIKN